MKTVKHLKTLERTLFVGCGALAEQVVDQVEARLNQFETPREVAGLVRWQGHDLESLSAEIQRISSIDTRAALHDRGWILDVQDELFVQLVIDTVTVSAETCIDICDLLQAEIRKATGRDSRLMLMLLCPTGDGQTIRDYVQALGPLPSRLAYGVLLFSRTNHNGLQLVDESALATRVSLICWALYATVLRQSVLQQIDQQDQPLVNSAGVADWHYEQGHLLRRLSIHFQHDMLRQWLEDAGADVASLGTQWQLDSGADADSLQHALESRLLGDSTWRPTALPSLSWQMPWPWRMRQLYRETVARREQAVVQQPERQAFVFDMSEDIAAQSRRKLIQRAVAWLNQNPLGGVASVGAIAESLKVDFGRNHASLVEACQRQVPVIDKLTQALDQADAELQSNLLSYPEPRIMPWLQVCLSPWRWIHVAKAYDRLRKLGRRLEHVAGQLEMQRNTHLRISGQIHATAQLRASASELANQVDEVEAMLRHCVAQLPQIEASYYDNDHERAFGTAAVTSLYQSIVSSPEPLATALAHSIGGLGTQLHRLDESLPNVLAKEGLRFVDQHCDLSLDAVLWHLAGDLDELGQWGGLLAEQAAPLWYGDLAALDEAVRNVRADTQWLLAAQPHSLADVIPADYVIPHFDSEHMLLFSLQQGAL